MKRLSLIILASGEGSNAEAILRFAAANPERLEIVALVSDRAQAPALAKAKAHGIPALHIPHTDSAGLLRCLEKYRPDWACLAGYLRIVGRDFLDFFWDEEQGYSRVLNIHPSLLPKFPGLNAYSRAFAAGEQYSGVTVHIVDEKIDHGPILLQESFPRLPEDNLADFENRGKQLEHKLYVQALEKILTEAS